MIFLEQVDCLTLRWSSSSDVGGRRGGCGYLCSILPLIAREDIKFVNCKPQYLLFYLTLWYLFTEQLYEFEKVEIPHDKELKKIYARN